MSAAAARETLPVIKILVVGDAGVGKTSVIHRFVNDAFFPAQQPTVGVDFFLKDIALEGGHGESPAETVRVQLWDIAGQDRSKKVNRVYFKGALGALVVYDISRPQTFDSAVKWKQELDTSLTLPNGESLPVVLLGNKVDLEVAKVDVSYIDGFVQKHGFIAWSDVSAKDAGNADFKLSVDYLISRILSDEELFGSGMRRSAEAFSKKMEGHGTPQGIQLGSGGLRWVAKAPGEDSNSCCG
eukprot:jgi/Undpi1/1549/HiC_scaffold_11.g04939.m1